MLDFNPGSWRAPDDPEADPIGYRITDLIDAGLVAKNLAQAPRTYVGASSLGNPCVRQIQLDYIRANELPHAPEPDGDFNGHTLRIFANGHAVEDLVAGWLIEAGFKIRRFKGDGTQMGFSVADGRFKGHFDGVVTEGPLPLAYPLIWECKGLNNKNWQKVVKHGVVVAKPVYATQIATYQAYTELTNPALFTVLNKDTQELHHELVAFDRALAQSMSDRAVQILKATDAGELLPRVAARPDYFECRWCRWKGFCWG